MIIKELESTLLQTAAAKQWQAIGIRHHHGFCTPLSALRTEKSCGVGEYLDLLPLFSWAKEIGFDVIQLLPLNDTGLDTSPYNAISAFALHPSFLSLWALPEIQQLRDWEEKLNKIRYWNRTLRIKYHIVRELKLSFLREYFALMHSEMEKTEAYQHFLISNSWLEPYALFKCLKEKNYWKSWEDWPTNEKSPSEALYREYVQQYKEQILFHIFLQYLCYEQMAAVKKRASEQRILLKGDIPILISRDSADVWHERHHFLLHLAAGAPPDNYSLDGQNWGFPVYDWEELAQRNYNWWRERLQIANHFYHLYRLDHVVGFFRIWSVPIGRSAKEGRYLPESEKEWIPHGEKIMQMMLDTVLMFPIGEDLGTVPPEVRLALYRMGICGTKLMRWERRWETDKGFIPVEEYPPTTMATVSTHDSDTLQLWWRHSPKEAKLFCEFKGWDYKPFLSRERHAAILKDCHHASSLFHINLLQEYLALIPDLVSQDPEIERINWPGRVLETNWTYRTRPTIEQIVAHDELKKTFVDLLK
jgi:4-alpha-glucanotransferase